MLVESTCPFFPQQTLQVLVQKGLVLSAQALWEAGRRSVAPSGVRGIPVTKGSPCTGHMVTPCVCDSWWPRICGHLCSQPQVCCLISNIPQTGRQMGRAEEQ